MDGKISRPWAKVGLQPARPAGPPAPVSQIWFRDRYLLISFTKTSHWSLLVKAFAAMTSHGGDVAENV